MIKSMTGFGRAERTADGLNITVEIRSVNHRYYEYSARVPRNYGFVEDKLKSVVGSAVSRGKVEVSLSVAAAEGFEAAAPDVSVDMAATESYINAMRSAGNQLGLTDDLSLSFLMRLPDIFVVSKPKTDEDAVTNAVCEAAAEALDALMRMRIAEGANMYADITARLQSIEDMVSEIDLLSPQSLENYRIRLYNRLSEVLEDSNIDEQRIVAEAAVFPSFPSCLSRKLPSEGSLTSLSRNLTARQTPSAPRHRILP